MEVTVSCVYIYMLISVPLTTLLLPRHKQTEFHKHEKSIQGWGSRESGSSEGAQECSGMQSSELGPQHTTR